MNSQLHDAAKLTVFAIGLLAAAGPHCQATPINIDTQSLFGAQGFLDFVLTSTPPSQPASLTVSGLGLGGGLLGTEALTGAVEASFAGRGELTLLNTAQFPSNEDFVPITFGSNLQFDYSFGGPAVTNPDGVSGTTEFTFSILDSNGNAPLLLQNNWQTVDPGGFALVADLANTGTTTATSFLPTPEPPTYALLGFAFAAAGFGAYWKRRWARLAVCAMAALVCAPAYSQTSGAWQQLNPAIAPSARFMAAMAYDSLHQQVVLFGGSPAPSTITLYQDTWAFDGTNWANRTPQGTASPSPRSGSSIAFDARHGTMVLFGGRTSGATSLQMIPGPGMVLPGRQHPANLPPGRSLHNMAYDQMRGRIGSVRRHQRYHRTRRPQ